MIAVDRLHQQLSAPRWQAENGMFDQLRTRCPQQPLTHMRSVLHGCSCTKPFWRNELATHLENRNCETKIPLAMR